jgi:hypothetical protein
MMMLGSFPAHQEDFWYVAYLQEYRVAELGVVKSVLSNKGAP